MDNIVYTGEAASTMRAKIPSNSIDLTITSPPYDQARSYDGKPFTWDNFCAIALELHRVTKPGGVVVWVVNDQTKDGSESLTSFKQALFFKENCKFKIHDTMIYLKTGFSNPSNNRYHQVFEYMFVLVKGKLKTFNPIKDRKNKYAGQTRWGKNTQRQIDGTLKQQKDTPAYGEFGMRFNVWQISAGGNVSTSDKVAFDHPAIFPEALALDHILSWSNPGDVVLDPMAGSGTTLKMAALNDRSFIGIEQYDTYIDDILMPRLEAHSIKTILDKSMIL